MSRERLDGLAGPRLASLLVCGVSGQKVSWGWLGLLQLDGLVSIGAHEIVEWITDPDGDAWWEPPPPARMIST